MPTDTFYGRWYGNKVRPNWWSLVNWLQGYKFGPVQRHRCCGHTTPTHSLGCPTGQAHRAVPMVATSATYCVTHGATDHDDGRAWDACRFRQLFYFENPMDEHTYVWSDDA